MAGSAVSGPRRILLAVTGLSPQVVTETVYALAVAADSPWVPTEVHVVTTVEGRKRAELALLSDTPGWFHRLLHDHDLPPIAFDRDRIHVLTDAEGQPLEDIRSPQDNECAADQLTEIVRKLTADEESELHVSIAGGRKTMGFYLGYALSLFGRPQDRLSHVLVSEPFESCWDFFYPTAHEHIIQTRNNDLADARDAQITLAEIPFVSLRHGLDERLLQGQASFSEAVEAASRALQPPSLELDLSARKIIAGGIEIVLPPVQLALYAVFARRAAEGKPPLLAPAKDSPDREWAERFMREYHAIHSTGLKDTERTEAALKKGMDGDYFSVQKSALHRRLRQALGTAATAYLIDGGRRRPGLFALKLPPAAIRFSE